MPQFSNWLIAIIPFEIVNVSVIFKFYNYTMHIWTRETWMIDVDVNIEMIPKKK